MEREMVLYRQANDNDFEWTFRIKENSTRELVEKIWGWEDTAQRNYHKEKFDPLKIKVIIYHQEEVGYISATEDDNTVFVENILIEKSFQGKQIGTQVLRDVISKASEHKKNVELQVFKINEEAKKLYHRLNFKIIGETELHYKMRYEKNLTEKIEDLSAR